MEHFLFFPSFLNGAKNEKKHAVFKMIKFENIEASEDVFSSDKILLRRGLQIDCLPPIY